MVIVKRRVISYLIVLDSRDGMTENLNHCRVVHVVLRHPCMLVREKVLLFRLLYPVFVIIWRIISPLCLKDLFLLMIILLPSLFGFYGTLALLSLCCWKVCCLYQRTLLLVLSFCYRVWS